jgi:hypothetical protein
LAFGFIKKQLLFQRLIRSLLFYEIILSWNIISDNSAHCENEDCDCRWWTSRYAFLLQRCESISCEIDRLFSKVIVTVPLWLCISGLLAAHSLVKRKNYEVHIYEKRDDLRKSDPKSLRTYPIGLQQRGLQAADPDLQRALFDAGVWVNGVALQGKYPKKMARNPSLYLDRNLIVYTMLHHITKDTKCGEGSSLHLHFEHSIEAIELDEKVIFVRDIKTGSGDYVPFDGLIAADGANSVIRSWLAEEGELDVVEEAVPNQYRTFSIPLTSYDGSVTLDDDRCMDGCLAPRRS